MPILNEVCMDPWKLYSEMPPWLLWAGIFLLHTYSNLYLYVLNNCAMLRCWDWILLSSLQEYWALLWRASYLQISLTCQGLVLGFVDKSQVVLFVMLPFLGSQLDARCVVSKVFQLCLARTPSPNTGALGYPLSWKPTHPLYLFSARPSGILPYWCTSLVSGQRLKRPPYADFWSSFFRQLAPLNSLPWKFQPPQQPWITISASSSQWVFSSVWTPLSCASI